MASFCEFFAGAGMVREGLGPGWTCLFANDIDTRKGAAYRARFGGQELFVGDVREVRAERLPGRPDLVWGSFPCQDLSLAGAGAGLGGERSGTFYPFWEVIRGLDRDGRAPPIVAVENVLGTLTSHSGRDFEAICRTFAQAGYRWGALVIDAGAFVPQSRPRLFVIGVRAGTDIDPALLAPGAQPPFHTRGVVDAVARLSPASRRAMLWWRLPAPPLRNSALTDILEDDAAVSWHGPDQTLRLISLMAPANRAKLEEAIRSGRRRAGCVYRRTRTDPSGERRQRAEVRFDDIAGCLRTPAGGSSRQIILTVEGDQVRSRLISARETARLMGLPDDYPLPANYNEAYHLTGDGVVVDVVRHLARHLFEPILAGPAAGRAAA